MSAYKFYTLDVFTSQRFGGNPLAVFPNAVGLDDVTMQAVAREFNLSETVFIFPPDALAHTCRLRIFTPGAEVPFAGHPTVGTALLLAKTGAVPLAGEETRIVFQEKVGPVPVLIRAENGAPVTARLTAAMAPQSGPPAPERSAIAAMLSLESDDILTGTFDPQFVTAGMRFLFIPVKDRAALGRTRLKHDSWERLLKNAWAPQVFVLCFDPELPGSYLRARMFAPALGIIEDPATGAAASALGGYLGWREAAEDGEFRWIVEQGFEMGRPSILEVSAEKSGGTVQAVHVGGSAVMVSEGYFQIS